MYAETMELQEVSGSILSNPEQFHTSATGIYSHRPFRHLLWDDCIMLTPLPEEDLPDMVRKYKQEITNQQVRRQLLFPPYWFLKAFQMITDRIVRNVYIIHFRYHNQHR